MTRTWGNKQRKPWKRLIITRYSFLLTQTYVVEPVGTLRRELSQTVLSTYNLFHEKQMTIVSIVYTSHEIKMFHLAASPSSKKIFMQNAFLKGLNLSVIIC